MSSSVLRLGRPLFDVPLWLFIQYKYKIVANYVFIIFKLSAKFNFCLNNNCFLVNMVFLMRFSIVCVLIFWVILCLFVSFDWIIDEWAAYRALRFGSHDRHWWFRQGERWVYGKSEGRHDKTGVRVAIKILNKRKMKNKNMIAKVAPPNSGQTLNQNSQVY